MVMHRDGWLSRGFRWLRRGMIGYAEGWVAMHRDGWLHRGMSGYA